MYISSILQLHMLLQGSAPPFLIQSRSHLCVFSADYLPDFWQTCLASLPPAASYRAV